MKLTHRQRNLIIFVVIEEVQRLAKKFGLIDGLEALQVFKDSVGLKDQSDLVDLFEQDTTDTKTESLLNKIYKANEDKLLRLIGEIFAIKLRSKSTNIGLKHVIDLSEKALKKLAKSSKGSVDSETLNEHVKINIREYIKLKFGVSRNDIREARSQLEKRLGERSGEALSTISSCARLPLLLLTNDNAQDFNYHGININGLYKLIKILNGIQNKELARSFLHFFGEDNAENRQIIGYFFAAERTAQYCRQPTMLVQILSLLVTHNKDYETLSHRFVDNIIALPDKTSIESLMAFSGNTLIKAVFNDLFESTLLITSQFNYILAAAKLNIAERGQRINELNSTQDIFLKSVFYFCFVSPLLERIESQLKKQNTWQDKDIQKLRLELSTAFHVMLGMRSGAVKHNSISKAPLLLDLVTADEMREKVTLSFAAIGFAETKMPSEIDSFTPSHAKHQRHYSRTESEHSLFSGKSKSSKNMIDAESSSSEQRKAKHGVAIENSGAVDFACSSNSEEHFTHSGELSKKSVYLSRTMSFYSPKQSIASSSSSSSEKEKVKKRTQSSTVKKNVTRGISTSKIPLLPIKQMLQVDNSLESYFNHLFACDSFITTQFVLSLIRPKDSTKLSWGIRVLNEASGKSNRQIATVLLNHLTDAELLIVFAELFQMEATDSWCRGNKLLSILIQQYLTSEECKEYKKMVWSRVFSLSSSLSKIDVSQCELDAFIPEGLKPDQSIIDVIQNDFLTVVNTLLSPKQYPSLMWNIYQLGYADLIRRDESDNTEDVLLRKLTAFILIRFINPIICQEAQLLMNPVLKQWYLTTIPSAIQSLTSPLSIPTKKSDNIPSLRDLIFSPITKDMEQRNKIYKMMAAELHVGHIVVAPLDGEQSLRWDNERCKRELNDMLKQEQFSGLIFKPNGTVTPRRDSLKPLVRSFFESPPTTELALLSESTTPRDEVVKLLLQTVPEGDVDDERASSSSGTVNSPKVNFTV